MTTTTLKPLSAAQVQAVMQSPDPDAMINALLEGGDIDTKQAMDLVRLVATAQALARLPSAGQLRLYVGPKGTVCLGGINKQCPIALYASQWERLADFMPKVLEFIKEWEGREWRGEAATRRGGPKEPYTAMIARR
jgi:hypothetical protein